MPLEKECVMSVLGIDYGDRRIGLAAGDALGLVAHGLPTLENTSIESVLAALRGIIKERNVDEIVLGLPLNMDGSEGPQAQKARAFGEALQTLGKPVHFADERLTTERAHRALKEIGLSHAKRRKRIDRLAAQFILQVYLDSRKQQAQP